VILIRASANNVHFTHRAKLYTIATNLARFQMQEVEEKLLHDGMSQLDDEDDGDFSDQDHGNFKWHVAYDKIVLPAVQDTQEGDGSKQQNQALVPALGGTLTPTPGPNDGSSGQGALSAAQMGMQMVGPYLPLIQPIIEQAIRRVTLTVSWQDGNDPMHLTVVCFFTDTGAIDQAMQMFGGAAAGGGTPGGVPGSTPTGSRPTPQLPGGNK
jgi:hypothetical protein